jgi:hypothetical protein
MNMIVPLTLGVKELRESVLLLNNMGSHASS